MKSRLRFLAIATLASTALSALPVATAAPTAKEGSIYAVTDGAARGSAATGSGDYVSSSAPNYDPHNFYSSLPRFVKGKPGQILKTSPSNFALGLPLVDWTNSKATRVAYVSTDDRGRTIPVTGTVLTSSAPWNGPGPRPLLTVAPGTQGSSNSCAPSKLLPWGFEYEAVPVATALARGWNVALTDLHGLGTKPQHTYMNRVIQAHATLDMARAAVNLHRPGLTAKSPVATWGYSQGGGSSAAALELAHSYAPDVNLKAGYAGGVPADLDVTATAIDNGALAAAMGYTINGMIYQNPELRPLLDKKLNARGKRLLLQTRDECVPESLLRHAYRDSRKLTTSGHSISQIMREEPIRTIIEKQRIGKIPPRVPVYVGHGTSDDTIPVQQSRRMAKSWCAAGTPVYYQEHKLPALAPLADHMIPMFTHLMPAFNWLEKVIKGQPYPTTPCNKIPGNPKSPFTPQQAQLSSDTAHRGAPGSVAGTARGSSAF